METLTESIKSNGLIQPIIVRPIGDGYEILSGHRRTRAITKLGGRSIKTIVADVGDEDADRILIDTNFRQRSILLPSEIARSYKLRYDDLKLKSVLNDLQMDNIRALQCLSRVILSGGVSEQTISAKLGEYLCELKRLCVKSRAAFDKYLIDKTMPSMPDGNPIDITGNIEVTSEGWLHMTLNTFLPNCRRRTERSL